MSKVNWERFDEREEHIQNALEEYLQRSHGMTSYEERGIEAHLEDALFHFRESTRLKEEDPDDEDTYN